jgi:hypothetical protein
MGARKKLEATRDPAVLGGAGEVLWNFPPSEVQADLDVRAVSMSYLEGAVQLDPEAIGSRQLLEMRRVRDRTRALSEKFKGVPREKQAAMVSALPDAERVAILPQRVGMEYMNAEYLEYTKHDQATAKVSWDQTKKYADDLLRLSNTLPNDPSRGTAFFSAHVALAVLALHDNDKAAALRHMEEAGKAPASDDLKYGFDYLWQRLATGMLKRGERESVAQFLDRYAQLNESQRDQLTKSAAAIRAGKMPEFYQYQVTPR